MRFIAIALVAGLAVSLARTHAVAQDAALVAPSPACGSPSADLLFARLPAADRSDFFLTPPDDPDRSYLPATPRVFEVELDGAAPREAVLGLDAIARNEDSHSAVWIFACRGGAWSSVGGVDLGVDSAWDGTFDDTPGLSVLRAETIPGIDHDLLRVEHVDVRGGYDPRFVRRELLLVHVVGGEVVTALEVIVREEVASGPDRAQDFAATRTIILGPGTSRRPPRYRLVVRPSENERPRRGCRTWLVFDGRTFVPTDPRCAAL